MTDTSNTSPASIFKPVIAGLARHALTGLAGILAGYGVLQTNQETQFIDGGVAVVLFVAGAAWSWWQKHQTVKPTAVAAANKLQMLGPIAFLLATAVMLSACSSQQMSTGSALATDAAPIAATVAVDAASPAQLADLQKACTASGVLVAVADNTLTGGAAATVPKIAAPGAAFCKIVMAGKVPGNADANSAPWLGVLGVTISTVKALAG